MYLFSFWQLLMLVGNIFVGIILADLLSLVLPAPWHWMGYGYGCAMIWFYQGVARRQYDELPDDDDEGEQE